MLIFFSPHEGGIKNASMSTRANMKLQLMKQQLESEARHEPRSNHGHNNPQASDAIPAPSNSILNKEVPPHIYEVRMQVMVMN